MISIFKVTMKKIVLSFFLIMGFSSCIDESVLIINDTNSSIPIASSLENDTTIQAIYKPYKLSLDSIMNEVLCYSPQFLEKDKPESRLSNWMADVCLKTLKQNYTADFCLLNHGGIRATLPKGNITTKNIFQIMPFENELVIIEIPDTSFYKVLDYLKESKGHPISGIQLNFKEEENQHNLQINNTVRIATSDYLAHGGDQMYFFGDSIRMVKTNLKIRDVLLEECKSIDTLRTILDQRFTYEH